VHSNKGGMMKRIVFLALLFLGVFAAYAQSIDKDSYTEINYGNFMTWLDTRAGNGTSEHFKIYLKYDGPSDPGYNFKDGDKDLIIASDTSEIEANFEQGQDVIVYFTASGPLVWDRFIDLIELDIIEVRDASRIAPPLDAYVLNLDPFVSSPSGSSSLVPSNTDSADEDVVITLVPDPERPPDPGPVRMLVPSDTGQIVIRVDRDSGGNIWLSLEENGNPPPSNIYPPRPGVSPPAVKSSAPQEMIKIIPGISSLKDQKRYKLQVGAFTRKTAADNLAATLRKEGFSPGHEKSGNWNRVIIIGIQGSDVGSVAERLGAIGIKTIWVRE
jgi:hypothetical protein